MTTTDIPPAAADRLGKKAFTSGLSAADFAACLRMGLRPVGLVQGYYVMRWPPSEPPHYDSSGSWLGVPTPLRLSSYGCTHPTPCFAHRALGLNLEHPWVPQG